jgi:hypothetical protein
MKKALLITAICLIAVGVAGVMVVRGIATSSTVAAEENDKVSEKAAKSLQDKIDAIKKAEDETNRAPGASRVEISEVELESYMLFKLKEDIPAQMDSFDVQLEPGTVAAQTQLTFAPDATGNPILDVVVSGTHDLFVKGALKGSQGRGKFDLLEVRVDGIPVPMILIQSLFDKYVKPKYPDADLKEPFDLPWGIEELTLEKGRTIVVY